MTLVDIHSWRRDPVFEIIAAMNNGPQHPQRIDRGQYLIGHWNINQLCDCITNFGDDWVDIGDLPSHGVCDSPKQLLKKYDYEVLPVKLFISFVHIRRNDQPREGGWRWRKWGPYIGEYEPQCEYLHDEPDILEVYTFSVYQVQ